MLKSTLQHFAGDFGQTALNSLRFLKGNLAGAPNLGIFGNEDTSQHVLYPLQEVLGFSKASILSVSPLSVRVNSLYSEPFLTARILCKLLTLKI